MTRARSAAPASRRAIGFVGYDRVNALDIAGPAEAFTSAGGYQVVVLGASALSFRSESGLRLQADALLADAPPLDTLIIPGGEGLRLPGVASAMAALVRAQAGSVRRLVSVCTGIYGLAPTGLLDGRRVTTHWKFTRDIAARFPRLRVDDNAVFLRDGQVYTSAGVTAGIDLALALIEEDQGPRIALAAARDLVVYMRRCGGQTQYSEPLRFQEQAADGFSDLATFAHAHLHESLPVDRLAAEVALGERQFRRRFQEMFGCSPTSWVEGLRLDEARRRLEQPSLHIDEVAGSVGFRSADGFRRAFRRRFGLGPRTYRARFALENAVAP